MLCSSLMFTLPLLRNQKEHDGDLSFRGYNQNHCFHLKHRLFPTINIIFQTRHICFHTIVRVSM